jgi:hypothetical protein
VYAYAYAYVYVYVYVYVHVCVCVTCCVPSSRLTVNATPTIWCTICNFVLRKKKVMVSKSKGYSVREW